MKLTITSIELKNPLKFFPLSYSAMKIIKQLKSANHSGFKKRGVWTKHYTMTLWNNEEDLKKFAHSGAHLESMKKASKIAKELKTLTVDASEFPDWKTAKNLLNSKGKVIKF